MSHFLGKNFFADDSSQNMFVHRSTCNILKLKEDKSNEYIIGWKSKKYMRQVYASTFILLYTTFLYNLKLFRYKKVITFNEDDLLVEKTIT